METTTNISDYKETPESSTWVTASEVSPSQKDSAGRDIHNHKEDITLDNDVWVGGTLRAKRIVHPWGCLFVNEDALMAEYPHPRPGMWAIVGSVYPFDTYRCRVDGEWEIADKQSVLSQITNYLTEKNYATETWVEDKIKKIGVGLDESALKLYLKSNKYVTQNWIEQYYSNQSIGSLEKLLPRLEFEEMFEWVERNGQRFIRAKSTVVADGDLVSFYAGEGVNISSFATTEMLKQYITSEALEARLQDLNVGVGGLDMEALESYLTENSYATQDWVKRQGFLTGVTGFLPLSGGTLSDALTIQCGADTKLAFNNTDGEKYSAIKFLEGGTEYSRMIGHEHKFEFSKYIEAPKFVAQTTELCQNVNADMLDNLHALDFVRSGNALPNVDMNQMLNNRSFIGSVNAVSNTPNENGWYNVIQLAHRNGESDGPSFVGQIALGMTVNHERMYYRTHRTRAWQTVARLSDNVASATKLATARTIWGRTFDGTADITGQINAIGGESHFAGTSYTDPATGVGAAVKIAGALTQSGGNVLLATTSGYVGIGTVNPQCAVDVNGDIRSNSVIRSHIPTIDSYNFHFNNETLGITGGMGTSLREDGIQGAYLWLTGEKNSWRFATNGTARMIIDPNGKVGFGTLTPQFDVDVNGDICIRTGRIYLTPSVWIEYDAANDVIRSNRTFVSKGDIGALTT